MSSPTRHQRLQGHEDIHTEARCKELYVLTDEESTAQSHGDIHSEARIKELYVRTNEESTAAGS